MGVLAEVAIGLICTWRFSPEQFPDPCDIGRAVAVSVKPVVANAVLASWEHVEQETADELNSFQRHGGMASGPFETVILDAEGDMIGIGLDQTTVRDRNTPLGTLLRNALPGNGMRIS